MGTLGKRGVWQTRNRVSDAQALTAVEAAWVGAMIEGEGHIPRGLRTHAGHYASPNFAVTNTSVEIIATLLRVTGVGRVYLMDMKGRLGHKPVWRWSLLRLADITKVGQQIRPYLVDKRTALDSLLLEIGN